MINNLLSINPNLFLIGLLISAVIFLLLIALSYVAADYFDQKCIEENNANKAKEHEEDLILENINDEQ